ncbi:acyltransferase family protein [Streptomyces marispadix]|uniref:Acyltransferase n=1 Tax=Streptomyces marispadix TaxID=2922868 RepID=A0ABS9SWI2_9ACTN|nr:acyltransferase [Streptomyces marispadix]MCH6160568.1 acyltransferase [Streptomyces marispadix]
MSADSRADGPVSAPVTGHAPVPEALPVPSSASGSVRESAKAPVRDRYLDLLRALALVRVVVYHTFGFAWLTFLFPSMGVMFALAGSLTARSLARPALGVLRGRARRLLLPLWLYGAVLLSVLSVQGWRPWQGPEGGPLRMLCWLVPLGSPPYPEEIGSNGGLLDVSWALEAAGPLWYLRTYLWFVLASPLLLRAFRRLPWVTLLAPLALTAVLGTGRLAVPGELGEALGDFAVYGSCWLLGFAHHDGLLRRIPGYAVALAAPVAMAAGLWWASGHPGEDGLDLNGIPLAQALWSFGFCAVLLRVSPSWHRLPGPLRALERPVTLANSRAVTLYLWHQPALIATVPLLDLLWRIPVVGDSASLSGALESWYDVLMFLAVWPLVGLLIAVFGWAEDIAARRRARLWPRTKTAPGLPGPGRGRGPSRPATAPAPAPASAAPGGPLTGADRPR